jgi:hypothetical protein
MFGIDEFGNTPVLAEPEERLRPKNASQDNLRQYHRPHRLFPLQGHKYVF